MRIPCYLEGEMIDLREIRSLTDFQRNARDYIQRVKQTRNPLVLTVNGKAEVVVQDAEAYQEMLDRLERAETVAALRVALEPEERGEARPVREALEELRRKHGIPG